MKNTMTWLLCHRQDQDLQDLSQATAAIKTHWKTLVRLYTGERHTGHRCHSRWGVWMSRSHSQPLAMAGHQSWTLANSIWYQSQTTAAFHSSFMPWQPSLPSGCLACFWLCFCCSLEVASSCVLHVLGSMRKLIDQNSLQQASVTLLK